MTDIFTRLTSANVRDPGLAKTLETFAGSLRPHLGNSVVFCDPFVFRMQEKLPEDRDHLALAFTLVCAELSNAVNLFKDMANSIWGNASARVYVRGCKPIIRQCFPSGCRSPFYGTKGGQELLWLTKSWSELMLFSGSWTISVRQLDGQYALVVIGGSPAEGVIDRPNGATDDRHNGATKSG